MYYRFDRDLYADLGMTIPETMSFFEVEPYLKAAKEAYEAGNPKAKVPAPFNMDRGGINGITAHYDMINHNAMLGIPYSTLGTPSENTVVFIMEHQDALDRFYAVREWYLAGYINQDAMTLDSAPSQFAVSTGQGFYGADAIWSGGVGYPIQISKFSGPYLSTASIRGSMNAINARSEHISLALKLHELINTDLEYRDILRYGIPGEHWNETEDGLAQKTQAGRDGYSPWAFSQGSYSLSRVEYAEGVDVDPNMWDVVFEGYESAQATQSIGFSFDPINVETEIAALLAVKNKYWAGIVTGTLDTDETLQKYMSEAESAGIRKVVDECQRQLDEFVAAQQ
jgi:putative aldouronate transport system substrate-binding protein